MLRATDSPTGLAMHSSFESWIFRRRAECPLQTLVFHSVGKQKKSQTRTLIVLNTFPESSSSSLPCICNIVCQPTSRRRLHLTHLCADLAIKSLHKSLVDLHICERERTLGKKYQRRIKWREISIWPNITAHPININFPLSVIHLQP